MVYESPKTIFGITVWYYRIFVYTDSGNRVYCVGICTSERGTRVYPHLHFVGIGFHHWKYPKWYLMKIIVGLFASGLYCWVSHIQIIVFLGSISVVR